MALLRRFLIKERPTIMDNDIRLRSIGRIDDLINQFTRACGLVVDELVRVKTKMGFGRSKW